MFSYFFWSFFLLLFVYNMVYLFVSRGFFNWFINFLYCRGDFAITGVEIHIIYVFTICLFWFSWIFTMVFPEYFGVDPGYIFFYGASVWVGVRLTNLCGKQFGSGFEKVFGKINFFGKLGIYAQMIAIYIFSGVTLGMRVAMSYSVGHYITVFIASLGYKYFLGYILCLLWDLIGMFAQTYVFMTLVSVYIYDMI